MKLGDFCSAIGSLTFGTYHFYITSNMINENNRNIQLLLDENNRNIQLLLDENNRNNQLRYDELLKRIERLENTNKNSNNII